jgi:hypothetical protein
MLWRVVVESRCHSYHVLNVSCSRRADMCPPAALSASVVGRIRQHWTVLDRTQQLVSSGRLVGRQRAAACVMGANVQSAC